MLHDPVLLGMAALAAVVPVWFLGGAGGPGTSWTIQTGLDLCIFWFARRLAAAGTGEAHNRRFWWAMAAAGLMCAAGDAFQTVLVLRGGPGTPVSLGQTMLVVCAMTVMAVTMLRHPLGRAGRQRLRLWLDAGTVLAAVAVFLWYFSIGAELGNPRLADRLADRLAASASSIVMLVIVLGVLKLILSGTAPFTKLAGVSGCVGVTGTAVGTSASVVLTGDPDPRVQIVASLLPCILTAASLRVQELQQRNRHARAGGEARRFSLMPYIAVVATELLLVLALHQLGADPRMWGVAVGVLVITGLVLSRQLVAFHDNDRLLSRLDRSMRELHELHGALRHQATHDALTGLANRALLGEHLQRLAAAAGVSVLVLDLDGFKPVNDQHGHHVGDELLIAVARRLTARVGPDDLVARLGGDEFVIVLPHADAARVRRLAELVTAALAEPYDLAGTAVRVGVSIGVATGRPGDVQALLREADADMYRRKPSRGALRLPEQQLAMVAEPVAGVEVDRPAS
jgi:diguanylate cyclase (GGDEF)-like protein